MIQSSLDAAAKRHAFECLGESEDVAKDAVKKIQKFLAENSNINAKSDDRTILCFLRSCKFNVELAEKKIRNHYRQRAVQDEWFMFRDPFLTEIADLLSIGVFLPLLQKDEENRQVVLIRTAAHSPSKHKQNDVFKVGRMILDYLVSVDESISVYGIRAIFDMQGISLGHGLQMTPNMIKKAVNSWESYPLRIKKLEFVNANMGINVILDIFRSFMTAKIKERVSVRRGKPDFKASDKLPKELGGTVDSYAILAQHWKQVLEKNLQWYEEDEKFKSLE